MALPDVEKYIDAALEHADNKFTIHDVLDDLSKENLVLWVIYNNDSDIACGCLVTEVLEYPNTRVLSIFLLGADDVEQTLAVLDDLKKYATTVGCKSIEFIGRNGWEKVLKSYGFEKIHTMMRLLL